VLTAKLKRNKDWLMGLSYWYHRLWSIQIVYTCMLILICSQKIGATPPLK